MNKEGNVYTFGFAIVMVIVVATLLSIAAISLKPMQKKNEQQEKMQAVLKTIGVNCTREEAELQFNDFVKKRLILDFEAVVKSEESGEIDPLNKQDAFNIDIIKEFKNSALGPEGRNYPLYVCEKDGSNYYVIPMVGKGLWGPIWGFVAIGDDMNTVFGASFDHKTETPGLGAEIRYEPFQSQFPGEKIFDNNGKFVSIKVIKGGAEEYNVHGVDAITGGTITSNGVTEMIERTLKVYAPYLRKSN
ncbi:MAG TPA: NADH:ubiquinone reductase (Na(+)-transporting) subunit C [Flavobacteriales bacterium]|nr:NADH:ubiquinone reductase (Na(+)-transporting) subunit C [Flavobacteriales bacterium]HIN40413.1 NADH:ubiquinone reductase (Na(+)-transporting) subunit C [Flavobacteriales bacterium]